MFDIQKTSTVPTSSLVAHVMRPSSSRQAVHNRIAVEMNGTARSPTTETSNIPTSCTGSPCKKQRVPGSEEHTVDGTFHINTAVTATLIVPLVALFFFVLLFRRIPKA